MRGVIFLDYKFCLTINSKLGTARLAREWLARNHANRSRFNRRRADLSIRLKRISSAVPDLTRVRGSLALSRSYEDSYIDANSLVQHNREWLRVRVDAFFGAFFCWPFLHG